MRYRVRACFETEARELVLSSASAENAGVLVADDCVVELRVEAAPHVGLSKAAGESAASTAITPLRYWLVALPWDSTRLRVCVNAINYGTGPLILRDGDTLAIRPIAPSSSKKALTYSINAISATSVGLQDDHRCTKGKSGVGEAFEREDQMRCQTIQTNLEEYAKWNNFYNYRFGDLSRALLPSPLVSAPIAGAAHVNRTPHAHRCTCGCLVLTDTPLCLRHHATGTFHDRARSLGNTGASEKATTPAGARTLISLFPSIPERRGSGRAAGASTPPGGEAPVAPPSGSALPNHGSSSPSLPFLRGDAHVAAMELSQGAATPAADKAKRDDAPHKTNEEPNNWSAYSQARHLDWVKISKENRVGEALHSAIRRTVPAGVPFEKSAVELFQRIGVLESAIQGEGCRYH